jgi:hypothetical protein
VTGFNIPCREVKFAAQTLAMRAMKNPSRPPSAAS